MARNYYWNYVTRGNALGVSGAGGSLTPFQGSYPGATVRVDRAGTTSLAAIYSTPSGAAKPNPFTASDSGLFDFWTDQSSVKLTFSGGGLPGSITIDNVSISASASANEIVVTDTPYSADPTGATDSTAAILAALAAVPAGGANVRFPRGTYLVSGSGALFTCAIDHTHLLFDSGVTFVVVPSAAVVVFRASNSFAIGFPLYGFQMRGEPRFTSPDTTFTKTMLELVDTSGAVAEIASGIEGSWHDAGNSSIGVHVFGREIGRISSSKAIAADRPVLISPNPNSGFDLDSWVIGGDGHLDLIANGHPNIEIEDCYLTNNTFSNINCNKGTDGLKATGTVNPNASVANTIRNLRFEQGTSATGFAVDWALHISRVLKIEQVECGVPGKGVRLRNVNYAIIEQSEYAGSSVALDVDACGQMLLAGNFWQAGTTFNIPNMRPVFQMGVPLSQPGPGQTVEFWVANSDPTKYITLNGVGRVTYSGTLASGATRTLSDITSPNAIGVVYGSFTGAGGNGGGAVALTPTGTFDIGGTLFKAGNVAANFCVLFAGPAAVLLVNNLAASVNYVIVVDWNQ